MRSFSTYGLSMLVLVGFLLACTPPLYEPDTRPKGEVRFSLSEVPQEARIVYLLADFNDWDLAPLAMVAQDDGSYGLSVELPEGVIYYKYAYSSSPTFDTASATYEDFPRALNRSSLLPAVTTGQTTPLANFVHRWEVQGRSDESPVTVDKIRFNVTLPGASESLYIAGVINNWTHAPISVTQGIWSWEYTLPAPVSLLPDAPIQLDAVTYTPWLEYKYTNTSGWDHEEINLPPTGVENSNRVVYAYQIDGSTLLMPDTVSAWK